MLEKLRKGTLFQQDGALPLYSREDWAVLDENLPDF